ncbi:MAG: peptidase, partial [Gammaproteobacteria bacterium]|nr:peptidase [Gammaproteobacteria bacterium]
TQLLVAPAVITPQNAWLMTSMMQDVIREGTATKARELGRNDLAGKTGTTNEQRDAWFCGFNRNLVASAWIGFDEVAPLGTNETGGHAALPIWMGYMGAMLKDVPEVRIEPPPGLVTVRIDPNSGLLAASEQTNAVFETFRESEVPSRISSGGGSSGQSSEGSASAPEQLF